MNTPADSTDLWLQSASGPVAFVSFLFVLAGMVSLGVSWARAAGRQA